MIALETVTTRANTLAPRQSHERNLALIQECVDDIVLVTDDDMRRAAQWLWQTCGVAAELSGAAATAAVMMDRVSGQRVSTIVCGRGTAAFED